jgi:uncharacterized membrane protein
MTFPFIQSDLMVFFAIAILVMLLLSELLSSDYDAQADKRKWFGLSWILSIAAWMMGIVFFAIFISTI